MISFKRSLSAPEFFESAGAASSSIFDGASTGYVTGSASVSVLELVTVGSTSAGSSTGTAFDTSASFDGTSALAGDTS